MKLTFRKLNYLLSWEKDGEQFAVTDLDRKCIFVTGSPNLKLDSVIAHEQLEQLKNLGE